MTRQGIDAAHERAIVDRIRRIPAYNTLRIEIQELLVGACRAIVPLDHRYNGVAGSYHGGLLMTAADSIACFAILTQTPADENMTTTDMNIRFLRPCFTDATVVATVLKLGKTLVPVAVDLFDAQSHKVAVAQVTYMRLPKKHESA